MVQDPMGLEFVTLRSKVYGCIVTFGAQRKAIQGCVLSLAEQDRRSYLAPSGFSMGATRLDQAPRF
jgi:hypothetical protein